MINRRKFLQLSSAGALGCLAGVPGGFLNLPVASAATAISPAFVPDVEIALTAAPDQAQIMAGRPTHVWKYTGKLLRGKQDNMTNNDNTYLGPTIRIQKGQKVRIHFQNRIPDPSIIHWHGLHVPADMDGHPRYVIPRGENYVYEFEVRNRAGMYWYHPHPHGRTGHQVYGGLAGLFIVSDDEEKSVALPADPYDIPLVIQDRIFDGNNQLSYPVQNMMERMTGLLGDRILVNGKPEYTLSVATRAYRLRLLNGSNSRVYKLAWEDGSPLVVIGSDGGLLEKPVQKNYVMLGPAERIELWADFSKYPVGSDPAMVSLSFDAGTLNGGGRGRGMMGGSALLPNGYPFTVFKVQVDRKEKETLVLPQRFSAIQRYQESAAVNSGSPRTFRLLLNHMNWTINGRTFRMEEVADDEIVQLNTLDVWEFVNEPGGMGMMGAMDMPHPIHIHGMQFQVLGRSGVKHRGYVDEGWKDTVLLMPGERVKLLVRFEDYPGLFLYHCHNLEHEDMGMMRNYYVRKI
ncbi:MAG: multicopper oxidase domain-containing protein [Desulfobacterales bacterium]|nr:multicopper oxidase domain-containing protein [Desulfobacterales bacterium]